MGTDDEVDGPVAAPGTHAVPTGRPLTAAQRARLSSRDRMVVTTARLLQRQGYHATGLQQVVDEASAPRGSIYHHFPGGKDELVALALGVAAAELTRLIEAARRRTDDPGDLVRRLGRSLERWLTSSDFAEGCPVSTVTLEVAPADPTLTAACRDAYAAWVDLLRRDLEDHGVAPTAAVALATTVLSGIEGALLLARAERSTRPLTLVTDQLATMVEAAVPDPPSTARRPGHG